MVAEPVHSVSILSSVSFCLLDIILLGVEELFYPTCLPHAAYYICAGHSKISN
jgi:hypothetical protein